MDDVTGGRQYGRTEATVQWLRSLRKKGYTLNASEGEQPGLWAVSRDGKRTFVATTSHEHAEMLLRRAKADRDV
jgi:hypothetical protein